MDFFIKLERKYGRYAIKDLMRYLTILYGLGFIIYIFDSQIYYTYLSLNIPMVMQGQLWRLVTWLIYPPSTSLIFGLLMLLIYYNLGSILERVWGSFRFNVFMFVGIFFHIIAAFFLYAIVGNASLFWILTPEHLNLSIFLAFSITFPDMQFMLYFVIPVKAKYLAIFYILIEAYYFITGAGVQRLTIALGLLNFAIYFLLTRDWNKLDPAHIKRRQALKVASKMRSKQTLHRCAVCGRTEADDDTLEFRFCSKCNGSYEYCNEHLYTHMHVE